MKDIVIPGKAVKRELWIILGCFIFAVLFDVFGIIKYGKPFTEVFRTIGFEIAITTIVYAVLAFVRIMVWLIFKLFRRK